MLADSASTPYIGGWYGLLACYKECGRANDNPKKRGEGGVIVPYPLHLYRLEPSLIGPRYKIDGTMNLARSSPGPPEQTPIGARQPGIRTLRLVRM